ncbi:Eukaryotic translation initiation factor 4B [Plecturocebus cupreus]
MFPTAPQAAGEPNIDRSQLPKSPPYTAFLGNLLYDLTEDFDYAEFEDLDSLDVADQAQDKDRDDRSFGRDRNRDSDKTDTDWKARPVTDSFDDYPPRRDDDSIGDKYQDHCDSDWYCDEYRDGYWHAPHQDMYQYGDRDSYDGRGGRGYESRKGNVKKTSGSGYHRDDDYRGGGDRYDRWDDPSWSSRDDYSQDDKGPTHKDPN